MSQEVIGGVPFNAINEIELASGEEAEELDLVDKDTNIVFTGADSGEDISISFTLLERNHPEGFTLEERRDEVKELVSKDKVENTFQFEDLEGRLAIESISFPESSDFSNIREGEISGKYLPWPEHYPDIPVEIKKRKRGEVEYVLDVEGLADTFADHNGDLEFSLELPGDRFGEDFGEDFGGGVIILNRNIPISSDVSLEYDMDGFGSFGGNFGSDFSEPKARVTLQNI